MDVKLDSCSWMFRSDLHIISGYIPWSTGGAISKQSSG